MLAESQVEALEITIEEAKIAVTKKDDLLKLAKDNKFIDIIMDGYFVGEASRLVLAKGLPTMQDVETQANIDKDIIAIGRLKQYFSSIIAMGHQANKAILDAEATIEEINNSEAA